VGYGRGCRCDRDQFHDNFAGGAKTFHPLVVLVPRRNIITKIKLVLKFNGSILISLILDSKFCSLHLMG
jgi:hypothetical protein